MTFHDQDWPALPFVRGSVKYLGMGYKHPAPLLLAAVAGPAVDRLAALVQRDYVKRWNLRASLETARASAGLEHERPGGAVVVTEPPLGVGHNWIWQADAIELLCRLPDQSVDIVVTSPPYNIKWKSHTSHGMLRGNKWLLGFMNGYDNYSDSRPEDEYQEWLRTVVSECLRVSKGLVWINHKTRYRDGVAIHPLQFLPFPMWSEVIWNRMGSIAMNHNRFAPSHEFVFGFGRPHYWDKKFSTTMSVWNIWPEQNKTFPCSYPEQLIAPLIEASCPAGGIVLDPFSGSGTTAVVARRLDRRFIGSDISPVYVRQSRERLAKSFTVPLTFDAPPAVQTALFAETFQ